MKSIAGKSLLLFLLAASCVRGKRVIRAAEHAEKTGHHIVKLHKDTSHEGFERTVQNTLRLSGEKTVFLKSEGEFKFFIANIAEEVVDEVKNLENVEYIEEETFARGAGETFSWALDRIDQIGHCPDGIYDPGPERDGEEVDIYILDTGIRYDHPEFGGRALYPGFDAMDDYQNFLKDYYPHLYEDHLISRRGEDCHGHGTGVASLAAGYHFGVAKNATLYSVRVLYCNDTAPVGVIIYGLDLAVEAANNSDRRSVISMSISGPNSTALDEAVEAATNAGIPVVVAAGNGNLDACYFSPASAPSAITVGGTAYSDRVYFNTNGGSCVDLFAPGELVIVADFGSEHDIRLATGTSYPTAIVSGVLAIYLQERPFLSVQELTQLLIDTSVKGVLDFSILSYAGLAETTPNRLVQVKNEACLYFTLGEDECIPARSCQEILQVTPDSKSGHYWLRSSNGSTNMVYCKMEDINGRKGMIRLAEIDMSKPNSECPGQLHLRTDPIRMCERASNTPGCSNARFSTRGIPYKTVCGRINAIQFGATNAFRPYQLNNQLTIDDIYVDGVVLSRVSAAGSRNHVWTFAAAQDEVLRPNGIHACPCTHNITATPLTVPPFIGQDYFCETGTVDSFQYDRFYVDDPLWDGNGCGPTSTCCSRGNYFCKTFDNVVSDNIELRLCGDESRSMEDSPVTLLELYIE